MLGKVEKYASVIVLYAVVQLVDTLIYKPEGHGFDSRSRNWKFFYQLFTLDHTMSLESTQPLAKISAIRICLGLKRADAYG